MAFISVFDVLGPNMIGPSSSHTAGAEIIAFLAQKMIAPPLKRADFTLYGSFAKTYHGHGTDRALLGGIMGFSADDTRIRDSFAIATDRGLGYSFTPNEVETDIHPNTVDIRMENAAGQVMTVRGESLGGGKVRIVRINGVEVDFTGEYNALIVVQNTFPCFKGRFRHYLAHDRCQRHRQLVGLGIAQTNRQAALWVAVYQQYLFPFLCQPDTEIGTGGRLADAALLVGYGNDV